MLWLAASISNQQLTGASSRILEPFHKLQSRSYSLRAQSNRERSSEEQLEIWQKYARLVILQIYQI